MLQLNFEGLSSPAFSLTRQGYVTLDLCPPWSGVESSASSRPSERGGIVLGGPTKRKVPAPHPVTSESGLSESSSPEGDTLWVGFERNQPNQPNPELWRRRGISMAGRCASPTEYGSCPPQCVGAGAGRGYNQTPDSHVCPATWEGNPGKTGPRPHTCALFHGPTFSLGAVCWEDFLSASSEDSSVSSLTEAEPSEIFRVLGVSGTWNLKGKKKEELTFVQLLTGYEGEFTGTPSPDLPSKSVGWSHGIPGY